MPRRRKRREAGAAVAEESPEGRAAEASSGPGVEDLPLEVLAEIFAHLDADVRDLSPPTLSHTACWPAADGA
jgi:hypothetical protein